MGCHGAVSVAASYNSSPVKKKKFFLLLCCFSTGISLTGLIQIHLSICSYTRDDINKPHFNLSLFNLFASDHFSKTSFAYMSKSDVKICFIIDGSFKTDECYVSFSPVRQR